jgi:phosphoenolpyruvate-protein phosphotransferase
MQRLQLTIGTQSGLHARPASVFVKKANEFQADIRILNVSTGSEIVDGKSILDVLSLGVEQGHDIILTAEGPDEVGAIMALAQTVQISVAGHGQSDAGARVKEHASQSLGTTAEGRPFGVLQGIAGAPGLAEGHVLQLKDHTTMEGRQNSQGYLQERRRLEQALATATQQIEALKSKMEKETGTESAAIFGAHLMFLRDAALIHWADVALRQGASAETSWQEAITHFADRLDALANETLRMRSADVRDVGQRVMEQLDSHASHAPTIPESSVIVARDLLPSQTASVDPTRVLALCTAEGGPTSHTSILARALGLPAVVGLGPRILDVPDGSPILVDGESGRVTISPDVATATNFRRRITQERAGMMTPRADAHEPAVTRDGHIIQVFANIGAMDQVSPALEAGAEGIGLLRTEFLFLKRQTPPTENEQFKAYRSILDQMRPRPVVLRTLDIGGDKQLPYLDLKREANPFLGYRGIRVCLGDPGFFKTQLRALWRAGYGHDLRIMFPFIATLEEIYQAKALLMEARDEVRRAGHQAAEQVKIGAMIEVPAAAILADRLARHVDFFSIGTNDLTQYLLAADRTNGNVAGLQDGCHPAVLRQIQAVAVAAHAASLQVGVCGELAADPEAVILLLGLGVDELSIGAASIPRIKAMIRGLSFNAVKKLAKQALEQDSAEMVRQLSRGHKQLGAHP